MISRGTNNRMYKCAVSETIEAFFDAYLLRRDVKDPLYSLCLGAH